MRELRTLEPVRTLSCIPLSLETGYDGHSRHLLKSFD
jgi:hypothetical protein